MAKTVRLEDAVYDQIYTFLEKGETFSQGVERLLKIAQGVKNIQSRGRLIDNAQPVYQAGETENEKGG